jgi:hypothetical protein
MGILVGGARGFYLNNKKPASRRVFATGFDPSAERAVVSVVRTGRSNRSVRRGT